MSEPGSALSRQAVFKFNARALWDRWRIQMQSRLEGPDAEPDMQRALEYVGHGPLAFEVRTRGGDKTVSIRFNSDHAAINVRGHFDATYQIVVVEGTRDLRLMKGTLPKSPEEAAEEILNGLRGIE